MSLKKKKKLKKRKKDLEKKKSHLKPETKQSIIAVFCFTFAIIFILSYFNLAGLFGEYLNKILKTLVGWGTALIPLGLIMAGVAIFKSLHHRVLLPALLGMGMFLLSILGLLHILSMDLNHPAKGGYVGWIIGYPLIKLLGFWASLIVLISIALISILITFNVPLRISRKKEEKVGEVGGEEISEKNIRINDEKSSQERLINKITQPINKMKTSLKINSVGKTSEKDREKSKESKEKKAIDKEIFIPIQSAVANYKQPSLNLLESEKGQPTSGDIKANANIIKNTLKNFGIEVEMAEVNIGPTVTQYTLRPAQGIKLSRITALQNDLALSLAAHPIRIEAPIPGRSLVGIEIPNKSIIRVRLRNLLEQEDFRHYSSNLTLALGRDVAGRPIYTRLEKMPHLLIAGSTGSGKTICLNSIIISLLYQNSPNALKLILIDPKRVEFTPYNDLPHLLTPVILEADKTIQALRWVVNEMERRFEILSENGSRDILSYNNKIAKQIKSNKENNLSIMPYLVVIIDELADLMASHGREIEATIVRLAQMARAVGIHLVVSTQRPSVEVITGLIKANITARIAFQVASQVDSRTILDMAGAERLLGNGDMLFLAGDASKPRRIQGAYISEAEVKRVVDFIKEHGGRAEYEEDLSVSRPAKDLSFETEADIDDELYETAKSVVINAGKASASLLQRRLRIGYARAARLLDIMEEKGIVGPADGAKPREILIGQKENSQIVDENYYN